MSDLQNFHQFRATAPAALLSAPLFDEQLSNVITNREKIICLIRPTNDVDTYITQALEDFFAKAEPSANASVFPPEVVPAIVSSLGNYDLMITSPDFHHRNCFLLRIYKTS